MLQAGRHEAKGFQHGKTKTAHQSLVNLLQPITAKSQISIKRFYETNDNTSLNLVLIYLFTASDI